MENSKKIQSEVFRSQPMQIASKEGSEIFIIVFGKRNNPICRSETGKDENCDRHTTQNQLFVPQFFKVLVNAHESWTQEGIIVQSKGQPFLFFE